MNARAYKTGQQPKGKNTSDHPDSDQVAQLAYQLYLDSGCEDGHDMEHWLRAEKFLESHPQSNGEHEEVASSPGVAPVAKACETAPTHTTSRTATRDEIRRQQIPPAARQSHSR